MPSLIPVTSARLGEHLPLLAARPLDDTSPALRAAARSDRWGVLAWQIAAPLLAVPLRLEAGHAWHATVLLGHAPSLNAARELDSVEKKKVADASTPAESATDTKLDEQREEMERTASR